MSTGCVPFPPFPPINPECDCSTKPVSNKTQAQAVMLAGIQRCHSRTEAETFLDDWEEVIAKIKADILPDMFFAE